MRIMVTSEESDIESPIDPRFARCKYVVIVDVESWEYEVVENFDRGSIFYAGSRLAERLKKRGEVVLTFNMGPSALKILREAGVEVVLGVRGTVKEAIENYISQKLGKRSLEEKGIVK